MNIYIIYNYWELLLSLMILETQEKNKNNLLIIVKNEIKDIIIKKLKGKYNILEYSFSPNRVLRLFSFYYKIYIILPNNLKYLLNKVERIISFSDQDAITRYFIKNKKYIDLYEHGNINYKTEFNNIEQKIKKILFRMEKPYGRNEYVKNIYLRGTGIIPEDIKSKVVIIDLEKIWENINNDGKKNILEIFGLDIKEINDIQDKEMILFTQPFSEDGVLTEREKLDLYKKIIDKYDKNKLIIKNHPREKTNYNNEFSDITILEKAFPSELLLFMGLKIKKVITVGSTVVSIFSGRSEIDFYGAEVHPKILKYYGNIDFFIKRNRTIDREKNE